MIDLDKYTCVPNSRLLIVVFDLDKARKLVRLLGLRPISWSSEYENGSVVMVRRVDNDPHRLSGLSMTNVIYEDGRYDDRTVNLFARLIRSTTVPISSMSISSMTFDEMVDSEDSSDG